MPLKVHNVIYRYFSLDYVCRSLGCADLTMFKVFPLLTLRALVAARGAQPTNQPR